MAKLYTTMKEVCEAVSQQVIKEHQSTGNPIVIWRSDRIVYLDPFTMTEVEAPKE